MLDDSVSTLLWPCAALMQLADPAVAHTEIDSGGYGNRASHRWSRTMEYMRMVAACDDEEIAALVREVNRIHASIRVPAGASPDTRRKPSFDPRFQLWVAATWCVSMLDIYQLLVSPIDDDVLDVLVADFARVGTTLQMRQSDWPTSHGALRQLIAEGEARYPIPLPRSGPDDPPETVRAGDVGFQVFTTYSHKRRMIKQMPRVRLLTWGVVGPTVRAAYGVEWDDDRQARFEREVASMRRKTALRPAAWRRREGRAQRRRAAERLSAYETLSYSEQKSRERRASRTG
ncbi:oxygenase MpaB family protein [Gordonia sp. (in: high G+C Gram-positive bacteria)]|uniref:oxygenase MpaB family protein n=1 Tax=Gordonia sp. (in: high G+C Gram-positive bacteria) TaxID=84139 RepID=UPI003C73BF5F